MDNKRCPTCGEEKSLSEFGRNKSKKDGLQVHCKLCRRKYNAQYYQASKDVQNPLRYERKAKIALENRQKLAEYLKQHPCVDCGETDIIVLQFDHQKDKKMDVSDMIRSYSWEAILSEIDKCEVVCANDHMRRTAKQFGWYKATLLNSEEEYLALN